MVQYNYTTTIRGVHKTKRRLINFVKRSVLFRNKDIFRYWKFNHKV